VISAVKDNGDFWFYWQTIGTPDWNLELVASAANLQN
jgi:hypothetical protein